MPALDEMTVNRAKAGDLMAQLQVADLLMISGKQSNLEIGEAIYVEKAKMYPFAGILLGIKYVEGVTVTMDYGSTVLALKDVEKAGNWLENIMKSLSSENEMLVVVGASYLLQAYIDSNQHSKIAGHIEKYQGSASLDTSGLLPLLIGEVFENAIGVKKDLEEALRWYTIAAETDLNDAIMRRNFLRLETGALQ